MVSAEERRPIAQVPHQHAERRAEQTHGAIELLLVALLQQANWFSFICRFNRVGGCSSLADHNLERGGAEESATDEAQETEAGENIHGHVVRLLHDSEDKSHQHVLQRGVFHQGEGRDEAASDTGLHIAIRLLPVLPNEWRPSRGVSEPLSAIG